MNTNGATTAPGSPMDLGHASTDGILATLEEIGLTTDRDGFRALARREGSPASLAGSWLASLGESDSRPASAGPDHPAQGSPLPEIPVVAAAWELWKRWAPDIRSAEILAEEFDRYYEPLDSLLMGSPGLLGEAIGRADRILSACSP
ncbi:MAG: hypothetical protein FD129_2446, partial [bacterium]